MKAALLSFTRSAAGEYASRDIRVNAIAPGPVDTHMMRQSDEKVIQSLAEAPLLRRLAQPDEMVGPVLLLASDAGSYITGQVIVADGGLHPY